ncbi:hypothetical protein D3C72_2052110 [compost metagenome]
MPDAVVKAAAPAFRCFFQHIDTGILETQIAEVGKQRLHQSADEGPVGYQQDALIRMPLVHFLEKTHSAFNHSLPGFSAKVHAPPIRPPAGDPLLLRRSLQ